MHTKTKTITEPTQTMGGTLNNKSTNQQQQYHGLRMDSSLIFSYRGLGGGGRGTEMFGQNSSFGSDHNAWKLSYVDAGGICTETICPSPFSKGA